MWQGVIERQQTEIDSLKSFTRSVKKARSSIRQTNTGPRSAPEPAQPSDHAQLSLRKSRISLLYLPLISIRQA